MNTLPFGLPKNKGYMGNSGFEPPSGGSPALGGRGLFLRLIYPHPVDLHCSHAADRFVKTTGKQNIHWFLRNIRCLSKCYSIIYFPYKLIGSPLKSKTEEIICIFCA